MHSRRLFLLSSAFAALVASAASPDITGNWTASFDSPIGVQNYSYVFKVEGSVLTGSAKSDGGEVALEKGKVEGATVSFIESRNFDGNIVHIEYKGKIISANEIHFTRVLEAFGATEDLVAKRSK